MPIKINNKEVINVSKGSLVIALIYKGATLVWQAIRSCFGRGFWVNDKPWSNVDSWKNNK